MYVPSLMQAQQEKNMSTIPMIPTLILITHHQNNLVDLQHRKTEDLMMAQLVPSMLLNWCCILFWHLLTSPQFALPWLLTRPLRSPQILPPSPCLLIWPLPRPPQILPPCLMTRPQPRSPLISPCLSTWMIRYHWHNLFWPLPRSRRPPPILVDAHEPASLPLSMPPQQPNLQSEGDFIDSDDKDDKDLYEASRRTFSMPIRLLLSIWKRCPSPLLMTSCIIVMVFHSGNHLTPVFYHQLLRLPSAAGLKFAILLGVKS